jgi:hypothetical protein
MIGQQGRVLGMSLSSDAGSDNLPARNRGPLQGKAGAAWTVRSSPWVAAVVARGSTVG